MRSKLSLVACVLLFVLFATGLVQSAAAAPGDDACLLLTQDQLKSALGETVAAGTHTTPTYLKTCTWKPSSGSTDTLKFLTLNLEGSDRFQAGKNLMQQSMPKNATFTQASGIGDDAYYTIFGTITSLMVKKGSVAFKLAMYGTTSPEKAMAIEKMLALQVLSKL